jgi:hypothetical protein
MSHSRARRWFQLSLKSLFLLTLLVATFFAGYSLATKQADAALQAEREAREELEDTQLELQRVLVALRSEIDNRGPGLTHCVQKAR